MKVDRLWSIRKCKKNLNIRTALEWITGSNPVYERINLEIPI